MNPEEGYPRIIPDESIEELLNSTRFRGLGRPSESGDMVLYLFRQENNLPPSVFWDPLPGQSNRQENDSGDEHSEIGFDRLCIIDDVTVSGSQAARYHEKTEHLDVNERVLMFLISTHRAKQTLEKEGVKYISALELAENEMELGPASPPMTNLQANVGDHFTENDIRGFCKEYGGAIESNLPPLGYKSCGLLLGLPYNTPNNTIPIFWSDDDGWTPVRERYSKRGGEPASQRKFI